MAGFFPQRDPMVNYKRMVADVPDGSKSTSNKKATCPTCKLKKAVKGSVSKYKGKGKKGILVIIDNATEDVDLLENMLSEKDIDLYEDCWLTYTVKCPTEEEIKDKHITCCEPFLQRDILKLKPTKILLMGVNSIKSLMMKKDIAIHTIDKWAGLCIPDHQYKAWLFPFYSLSYMSETLNKSRRNVINVLFSNFIDRVEEKDEDLTSIGDLTRKIKIITDEKKACTYLKKLNIKEPELLAFDIESTGLKPDRKGHKIRTISFCHSSEESVAFPMFMKNDVFLKRLKKVLRNKNIGKIAHNMKMEDRWVRRILKYEVVNWNWDSMIAAHVIDNRRRFTGLKFQSYAYFGLHGYEKGMKKYLSECKPSEEKYGNNRFNFIFKAPLRELLFYNGIDSIVSFELAKIQKPIIKERKLNYKLLHEAQLMFSDMEHEGICVDIDHFKGHSARLQTELDKLHISILNSEECRAWKEATGKDIDYNKDDLLKLLFSKKHLGLKSSKKTDKGKISIDNEALQKLSGKVSFIKDLLLWRKYDKLRNTFIKNILQEVVEEKYKEQTIYVLRPNNNLNLVISYRTSNDHPNWQNMPNRDPESSKIIRQGFVPKPGHKMLGSDYSGVEVNVSLAYHLDKNMKKYLTDKSTDMHRDTAMDIFMVSLEQITKQIRYGGKNGFVFPQFYGDWYKSCAKFLWSYSKDLKSKDDTNIRDHLKKRGIKNYGDFEEHIQQVEDIFWNERFPGYRDWKRKTYKQYVRKGYVRSHTGFECGGLMRKNEVLNLSIQGSACHCLLWSMIKLNKLFKQNKYKSKMNGQIHDEGCYSIFPKEEKEVLSLIERVMTKDIMKVYTWLQVPLEVEMEMSATDGNWYDREIVEAV